MKWNDRSGRVCAVGALLGLLAFANAASSQTSVMVEPPAGWFGVTLSDEGLLDEKGGTFFQGYPVVSEVEPNSPAAKAGVLPGDILVSFNSHDMRGSVFQLRSWLKPGAPFALRLQRKDGVRVVHGTLGRAPEGWKERVVIDVRPTEAFESRTRTTARAPMRSPQRVMVRTPLPTKVPSALIPNFSFGAGVYPFAGMEFTALNEDIRDLLGVKPEGVFVTNVVDGTPARIAGLKGGDVLLLANGAKLLTPVDLVQAISEAGDRKLNLRIIRRRKPQTLTLSW
jgi:S1-C subfamily serine protease